MVEVCSMSDGEKKATFTRFSRASGIPEHVIKSIWRLQVPDNIDFSKLDLEVRDIVRDINATGWLWTTSCCASHPTKDEPDGYRCFDIEFVDDTKGTPLFTRVDSMANPKNDHPPRLRQFVEKNERIEYSAFPDVGPHDCRVCKSKIGDYKGDTIHLGLVSKTADLGKWLGAWTECMNFDDEKFKRFGIGDIPFTVEAENFEGYTQVRLKIPSRSKRAQTIALDAIRKFVTMVTNPSQHETVTLVPP